jgi:hypothetical protein
VRTCASRIFAVNLLVPPYTAISMFLIPILLVVWPLITPVLQKIVVCNPLLVPLSRALVVLVLLLAHRPLHVCNATLRIAVSAPACAHCTRAVVPLVTVMLPQLSHVPSVMPINAVFPTLATGL